MHAHVYHEGVEKKGANNVLSLIIKTLCQLNLFCDTVGGELNIVFDNCSGQNINKTVIRLAGWLNAIHYFKEVNFIFLVVGHTKNAADRLFNCLKNEYHLQNLFTFQDLVEALNRSPRVTVHPTSIVDFHDYDRLTQELYRLLLGNIKTNHIFSCTDDGLQMIIRKSNLVKHREFVVNLHKKGTWDGITRAKIADHLSNSVLQEPIPYVGLNPYKAVEVFHKYRPVVPAEFQPDELYAEQSVEVYSKVKKEKVDRTEFHKKLKADKYANSKEHLESIALAGGAANSDDASGDVV
jgi:hypothetical protein